VLLHLPMRGQSESQEVLKQVVTLRADFLEFLADMQKDRVRELTRELTEVQQRLKQLEGEERQRNEQIAQTEAQLAAPELEVHARPEIEALRTQLTTEGAERLRAEYAAMSSRQTELQQRIEREQHRGRALRERSQQLQSVLRTP
jgi:phage I-like protein